MFLESMSRNFLSRARQKICGRSKKNERGERFSPKKISNEPSGGACPLHMYHQELHKWEKEDLPYMAMGGESGKCEKEKGVSNFLFGGREKENKTGIMWVMLVKKGEGGDL